jgi:hypothetical protein
VCLQLLLRLLVYEIDFFIAPRGVVSLMLKQCEVARIVFIFYTSEKTNNSTMENNQHFCATRSLVRQPVKPKYFGSNAQFPEHTATEWASKTSLWKWKQLRCSRNDSFGGNDRGIYITRSAGQGIMKPVPIKRGSLFSLQRLHSMWE